MVGKNLKYMFISILAGYWGGRKIYSGQFRIFFLHNRNTFLLWLMLLDCVLQDLILWQCFVTFLNLTFLKVHYHSVLLNHGCVIMCGLDFDCLLPYHNVSVPEILSSTFCVDRGVHPLFYTFIYHNNNILTFFGCISTHKYASTLICRTEFKFLKSLKL